MSSPRRGGHGPRSSRTNGPERRYVGKPAVRATPGAGPGSREGRYGRCCRAAQPRPTDVSGDGARSRPRTTAARAAIRPAAPADMTQELELFHPDGRPCPREERPLRRSLATGEEVLDEEYVGVRPDGRRVILRCTAWPVYDKHGEIVAGALVLGDMTQERRAEEQLAYHARLADIVEDAVVGTDAEFRLTVWNGAAERLYGYVASEVLGRDARDIASYTGDTSRIQFESQLLATDRAAGDHRVSQGRDARPDRRLSPSRCAVSWVRSAAISASTAKCPIATTGSGCVRCSNRSRRSSRASRSFYTVGARTVTGWRGQRPQLSEGGDRDRCPRHPA
jgi:PAS domain-containing protein